MPPAVRKKIFHDQINSATVDSGQIEESSKKYFFTVRHLQENNQSQCAVFLLGWPKRDGAISLY